MLSIRVMNDEAITDNGIILLGNEPVFSLRSLQASVVTYELSKDSEA